MEARHPRAGSIVTSWGRATPSASVMKVGAPFSIAKSVSTQLVRTVISRAYTRYFTLTDEAPPVAIRQRFLSDFSTSSARPSGADAVTSSTCREYSRTMYDPGVHTAIISSTAGRPPVGTTAVTST